MPKLILRTIDGKPLSNLPKMHSRILELTHCDQVTPTVYAKSTNINGAEFLKNSLQMSIERATLAFNYVCESLKKNITDEKNKKIIEGFIQHVKKMEDVYLDNLNKSRDQEGKPKILASYLKDLKYLIEDVLTVVEPKTPLDAKKLITEADNYLRLTTEKERLVTITPLGNNYVVQIEIPQFPLDTKQLNEILLAKPGVDGKPKPNAPRWYQIMSHEERLLFDFTMRDINTIEDIKKNITTISSKHRTIPGVANFSKHSLVVMDSEGKIIFKAPDRFRSSMAASRDIPKDETKLKQDITVENFHQIVKTGLENKVATMLANEKYYLNGKINEKEINYKKILEELNKTPVLWQTLISPIGIDAFVPDQGLYDSKLDAIKVFENKKFEIVVGNVTLKIAPKLFHTNHPLNRAKSMFGTGSTFGCTYTTGQIKKLIQFSRKALFELKKNAFQKMDEFNNPVFDSKLVTDITERPSFKDKADILSYVIADLTSLVDTPPSTFLTSDADHRRELHFAALEEIAISCLDGISYGSCVSGKDRKALETMYADSLLLYYFQYGSFLKFDDKKENIANFNNIFADLFLSRHQQTNAGQNAPGANGCKTPFDYLPYDMQDAIRKRNTSPTIDPLKESDVLANNNEFDKVMSKSPRSSLSNIGQDPTKLNIRIIESKKYTPEKPTSPIASIVNKLIDIVESKFWRTAGTGISLGSLTASKTPSGIQEMRKENLNRKKEFIYCIDDNKASKLLENMVTKLSNYQSTKKSSPFSVFSGKTDNNVAALYTLIERINNEINNNNNNNNPLSKDTEEKLNTLHSLILSINNDIKNNPKEKINEETLKALKTLSENIESSKKLDTKSLKQEQK